MRFLLSFLGLLIAFTAWSQDDSRAPSIRAKFENADIRQVIAGVGETIGKSFLIHEDVRGKVTFDTAGPVPMEDFYDLFVSTLASLGFDGISLDTPDKAAAFQKALQAGTVQYVTVIRNGKVVRIQIR